MHFWSKVGKFLGFIVSQRGIEVNLEKIKAILEMPSTKSVKEIQKLAGWIVALNRFISRSADKCLPFFKLIKNSRRFVWDDQCEKAFTKLKAYLNSPPLLVSPKIREKLYLYLAAFEETLAAVLIKKNFKRSVPNLLCQQSLSWFWA